MAADWESVLDELEERLEAHRATLTGGPALTPYRLPDGLGPLPVELVGRATRIRIAQRELEEEVVSRLALLRTIAQLRAAHAGPRSYLYLDESA